MSDNDTESGLPEGANKRQCKDTHVRALMQKIQHVQDSVDVEELYASWVDARFIYFHGVKGQKTGLLKLMMRIKEEADKIDFHPDFTELKRKQAALQAAQEAVEDAELQVRLAMAAGEKVLESVRAHD